MIFHIIYKDAQFSEHLSFNNKLNQKKFFNNNDRLSLFKTNGGKLWGLGRAEFSDEKAQLKLAAE